ncbi:hypothetical protein GCM10009665_17880 [Kitasatospora nipponensis]|uniref:Uncharacterized protein n=1 Tax=Kitasatospora nipponensis TaxID=258049 RepID=A0ABN1VZY2_9ACTN
MGESLGMGRTQEPQDGLPHREVEYRRGPVNHAQTVSPAADTDDTAHRRTQGPAGTRLTQQPPSGR